MFSWALGVIAVCGLYAAYLYLQTFLETRRFQRLEKTQDLPKLAQAPYRFGIDVYQRFMRDIKNRTLLDASHQRYKANGDTYSFHMFGQTVISTRDPENVKALLATQFQDFSLGQTRYDNFVPMLGEGIFTHTYGSGEKGEPWRHSRMMLRPQFSRQQVQDLAVLETFVQNLLNVIPTDRTVDLQPLFFKLTMDTATDFLFGESVNSLLLNSSSEEVRFARDFTRGTEILLLRGLLGPFMSFQKDRVEFKQACDNIHSYIDKFTQKAIQLHKLGKPTSHDLGNKYVFLEEIARSINDPDRLRSELLNILLAGRDTTAGLLSICFHQLARNKDVWERLRSEIRDTVGDRKPTYEDIKSMKYLRNVLNETLRLFPIVPENGRQAIVTTTLPRGGGPDGKQKVLVPKGTDIFYSVWAMHRNDTYSPDPEVFRPSRWDTLRVTWDYLPFNGGPRICLGQQYALTEASYVIIRLLQTFEDIENRDPVLPFIEKINLTMSSGTGTQVALKPVSQL